MRLELSGWNKVGDQGMWWHNGHPGGFWYLELRIVSHLSTAEIKENYTTEEIHDAINNWFAPTTQDIKQIPFTSSDIIDWIHDYCKETQHIAIVQVPKLYGTRIQSYYNHLSMVFDWKHKIKLSKLRVFDCKIDDKIVIPAEDMFKITVYEKSERQKCIDDCRRKHLPDNYTLRGEV